MPPARHSEFENVNLFQAIVEQTSDAIILADRDGMIRLWNHGAEALFGYPAGEVLGNSLDIIVPERLRQAHWEGFHKAIDTRRTRYANQVLTTRSMHKDGSKLYVDMSFNLVRDNADAIIGVLAIARNCTTRHLAESALRARLAELEEHAKNVLPKD